MSTHSPSRPVAGRDRPWARWLVIAAAVVGLAAAAVFEGARSNRWGTPEDVRAAAARLDAVPAAFGDWTSEEVPMPEKVLKVAEAAGHVSRSYSNRKNGARVAVLLLCGPSGPIGSHTPDVCYAGNGFSMSGEPQKKTVTLPDASSATYWSVRFEKKSPPNEPLRVCWMWGTDGDWEAAANPRLALRSALYKLYVVRHEPEPGATRTDGDPIHEFLSGFLPEVKKALAPAGRPETK